MILSIILATTLTFDSNGISFSLSSETGAVNPGRSVFLTVKANAPADTQLALPELSGRLRGFSSSEVFNDEPVVEKDGSKTLVANWRLVPEPCAERYSIAPFVVAAERGGKDSSFVAGPFYFAKPPVREKAEGGIEINPEKDSPPFGWKRLGVWTLWAVAAIVSAALIVMILYRLTRRVKEHFMSPIERAWAELGRLIAKGLPGRGRYKDFYVELTMVVRRYIQRKYGIRAPHLTTEEFLRKIGSGGAVAIDPVRLKEFLESADLVKFAGVEATPEMADAATENARTYLKEDDRAEVKK